MFLCGLNDDGDPTAINIANAKSIVLLRDGDGYALLVEFSDSEVSRTVQAIGASVCDATMLIPLMDHLSQKAERKA